jgi:hypothetical protein
VVAEEPGHGLLTERVGTLSGMPYDSRDDTKDHIEEVRRRVYEVTNNLNQRASDHDRSKLVDPERSVFDEYTPKLKDSTYGSDEYKAFLEGMGEGLRHHYEVNDHHPEHFVEGVHGMNLVQLIEMLCDWKAATMRHDDGDLAKSIEINADRFGYGEEIKGLLARTARDLGWC